MAKSIRHLLLIMLLCALTAPLGRSAYALQPQQYQVYVPLIIQQPLSLTGDWSGYLLQPGRAYGFALSLRQSATQISGTSTAIDGAYGATWSLAGTVDAGGMVLNELGLITSNPRPGTRWCNKQLTLRVTHMTQGAVALSGEWADPSCNAGTLYLERATEPKLPLAGVWSGVLNERGTQSSLTLELNQDGAVVHGQAIISHSGDTGTIALKGYLGGSDLYIEE